MPSLANRRGHKGDAEDAEKDLDYTSIEVVTDGTVNPQCEVSPREAAAYREKLLAGVFPGGLVYRVLHLQPYEKFLTVRLAVNKFAFERDVSPVNPDTGCVRKLFPENQAQPVDRKVRKPGLAAALFQIGTTHMDSQVCLKSRSVSPIHARSIGRSRSLP